MSRKPLMVYLTMKGGVGKTTLAANITRAIADTERKKILLIDADSQCNLTQLFCSQEEMDLISHRTIYSALAGSKAYGPSDLKVRVYTNPENGSEIDFVRGSFETFQLAVEASPLIEERTRQRFGEFIRQAEDEYDLVVMDTNPSATLVTIQALAVSNFLVAPISFDKFSMRGIHLITSLLRVRFDWLTNPLRVRIVPNKIKKAIDDAMRARLLADEKKVRDAFPDLSRCFVPTYVRDSLIISNENRRHGFVADQSVPNKNALKDLVEDFNNVALDLLATFRRAFGDEAENSRSVIGTMQKAYKSLFGSSVGRP